MAESVRPLAAPSAPGVATYTSARFAHPSSVDAAATDGDVEVHRRLAIVEPADRRGPARSRSRAVEDRATGARWCVIEADARATPGARAPRCLLFYSAGAVRRVWEYPEGWLALPDAALLALSEAPVPRAD